MTSLRARVTALPHQVACRSSLRTARSWPLRSWQCPATRQARQSHSLPEQIAKSINATGPLPLSRFMRQCLTDPQSGYYSRTTHGHDQIGLKGDFITSPEISQVFGEIIAIWMIAQWMVQGKRSQGVQLIELGPGRGTLMADILRTASRFPEFLQSLEGVYLVESSENLRKTQHGLLCGDDHPIETWDEADGYKSRYKMAPDLDVKWAEDLRLVPQGNNKTPLLIAHEFFDALPIHAFQTVKSPAKDSSSTGTGDRQSGPSTTCDGHDNVWRELLVSVKPPSTISLPLDDKPLAPQFQLSPAQSDTPYSTSLPRISPRYHAIQHLAAGATIEISPASLVIARDIAARIGGLKTRPGTKSSSPEESKTPAGAALIVDYGPADTVPANSLRGIKQHKRVSPLDEVGETDLSADVDFTALADAALAGSDDVEVHGPVEQVHFLHTMGGKERVAALLQKADAKQREDVINAWKRLVDTSPVGMGSVYKAMAILPRIHGAEGRRPVGFGGDI